jgi:hypothetical protein
MCVCTCEITKTAHPPSAQGSHCQMGQPPSKAALMISTTASDRHQAKGGKMPQRPRSSAASGHRAKHSCVTTFVLSASHPTQTMILARASRVERVQVHKEIAKVGFITQSAMVMHDIIHFPDPLRPTMTPFLGGQGIAPSCRVYTYGPDRPLS